MKSSIYDCLVFECNNHVSSNTCQLDGVAVRLFSGLYEKVLDAEQMATSVSDSVGVFFVPAFSGLQVLNGS